MAKKKPTAQQRDIERLAKDYQSSLMGLDPEYQSIFGEKTKALEGFSAQTAAFQKKLEDYQASLAEYKKNPFEDQKIRGSFRYEHLSKAGSADPYTWGYVIDGTWRSVDNLPSNYVEERVGGEYALKKKDVPKFTLEAPTAPDVSEFDTQIEQVKAKQKLLGEGYTREVAERKAGRVGAITQRAQSRPMLSKGVTL
jgi:hypothetical protein